MTEQLSMSDANASRNSFLSLFPSIILPMFLAVLDQTTIAAALAEIAASFGHVHLVLFAALAAHDAEIARLFHELIQRGPDMLTVLSQPVRMHLQEEVRGAFVAALLTIAGFAAMGTALAWSIPVRRL